MPENMDGLFNSIDATNAQLKALMKVIDEITGKPIVAKPADIYLPKVTEIVTSTTIRNLEMQAQEYAFDDGDLVHDIKMAVIELKYLTSIVKDLRERIAENEVEHTRLERLIDRS